MNMEEKDVKNAENTSDDVQFDINADADIPGTAHLSNPVEESSAVEKLEAELAEMKDKFIRQAAEFDNFRKRTYKEKLELISTAGKDVMIPLLEVLDDWDRAFPQLEKSEDTPVKEGMMLVFNKLRATLQNKGLKEMEVKGMEFNADLHEAITEIPVPGMEGKVVDVLEKGYYLQDKIIRFAKVVVGKS
jgi:molecular chaperone GrpE